MVNLSQTGMLITNIIIIILTIGISVLFFMWPYITLKEKPSFNEYFSNNKERLFASIILCIGFLTRVAFLDLLPGGLNQDEASAGYDAYAIMTTGMDRNGNTLPVHLVSWGSGQNALYSYLAIPFIFLLGTNEIALRLPMAIIGGVSIFLMYKLLNKKFDFKVALIGTVFLIISPWHLMKSRWALESNIFPDLVFIAFYFLMTYLEDKKLHNLIISTIILGISSYGYGTSYFFLFFFVIGYLIYLLIKKEISIPHSILTLGIMGVICLPIIMFLYINIFDKEAFTLLGFTIPKLNVDRFQSVTNLFSENFFENAKENMKNGLFLLFNQYDGLPWNGIPYFGHTYLISMPFCLFGLFHKDDKNDNMFWIMRIWLIVSILMMFIVSPNTNRINIVFFPIIFFVIFGIVDIIKLSEKFEKIIVPSYLVCFLVFSSYYASTWNENSLKPNMFYGLRDAISYVDNVENKNEVYVTSNVNMPYVFVLYYTEYDVNQYIDTVEYYNEGGEFEFVKSFGEYNFYLPYNIEEGNLYIVSVYDDIYRDVDLSNYKVTYYNFFYVIDATK